MSERKSNNFPSVIDPELTEKEEGFNPLMTGYQKKHIWASCRYCGKPHRVYGANFKKSGSACHKECRLKEQSEAGSPFSNPDIKAKAQLNRTKNVSADEINKRISRGRRKSQTQIEQTNIKKYGVGNPFQNQDIKDQIKLTHMAKLGVDHPQKSEAIKARTRLKFQETVVEDSEEHYRLVNILRGNEFWQLLADKNSTLKTISEHFDVKYKSILSRVQHDEFRDKYYATYTFPTQQQQREVANYIKSLGVSITENDRSVITPLELDIYVGDKKVAIEFNGSAWHSEMKAGEDAKSKHLHKTKLCNAKGINLIHIFEKDWEERPQQWKTFIRSALGLNHTRIAGRKCTVTCDQGRQLIEDSHIQGCPRTVKITFDLTHEGNIVGSMALSRHHRINDDSIIVLSRLAFKDGVTVQGGAGKLLSAAKAWAKGEGYQKIVSWSDNTWTRGNVYMQLGFALVDELRPDYFYWDSKNNAYVSKQSQRKSATQCPESKTEHEWAREQGLYRIWDCGKKRWEMNV